MSVKWGKEWEKQIMESKPVQADLRRRADNVKAAAGPGFEVALKGWSRPYKGAVIAAISFEARRRNNKRNTLIRALEAGRGD